MKSKAVKKIIISVVCVLLISGIAFIGDAFLGNPVSKNAAKKAAEKHLAEVYFDGDFKVNNVFYDLKGSNYNVHIISPSSIDSEFVLVYDATGNLLTDSYHDAVIERGNTSMRINTAYREAVDGVFASDALSFVTDIRFGDIEFTSARYRNDPSVPEYAVITNELELDKDYDVNELGALAGHLTVYAYDDIVSAERLAEMLLELRDVFDKANVGFFAVDFVLQHTKQEDGTQKDGRVEVINFPYTDIYEKNMVERVIQANEEAVEYYAEMDALKEAEISIDN